MRKIVFIVVVIMAALMSQNVSSQSFLEKMAKKAAKKAEKVAEKKAEEKAEEEVDDELEKIFEEESKANEEDKSADYQKKMSEWAERMASMGYAGEPVPIEDAYAFTSSMTMKISTYDRDEKLTSDGVIKIYTKPGEKTFAYEFVSGNLQGRDEMEKGIIIMDMENEATIILNGENNGLVYGTKGLMGEDLFEDEDEPMPEDIEYAHPNLAKTGRTKIILGYSCEEYKYKNEESEGFAWITKDINWKSDAFMSTVLQSSMSSGGAVRGFLMASENVDLSEGEKTTYEVTEINKNDKSSFSMSDYQLTNLGVFKVPEEENVE